MSSYDPLHPTLLEGRHKARGLTYKFNNLDPNTGNYEEIGNKRAEMLSELLGKVGSGTFIETPFSPDYGSNVSIGENCFMNFGLVQMS
jgi:acetyltransferase-like isoleucine patch superfamily enzyme